MRKSARVAIAAIIAASFVSFGCSSLGGCSAGSMRCHNNRAEMCDATNGWELWQDCSAVSEVCGDGPAACSGFDIACCN